MYNNLLLQNEARKKQEYKLYNFLKQYNTSHIRIGYILAYLQYINKNNMQYTTVYTRVGKPFEHRVPKITFFFF